MIIVEHNGQRYQMGDELLSTMPGFYDIIEAGVIHQGSADATYVNSVVRGPGKYYHAIPVSDRVLFEPGTVVYSHTHNARGKVLSVSSEGVHKLALSNARFASVNGDDLEKQGGLREQGRGRRWGWFSELDGVQYFQPVPGGMPGFTFSEICQQEYEWVCILDPSL
jgi:hypothetical protein